MTAVPPVVQLVLTSIIALSALGGFAFGITTFFRQGGWKRTEDRKEERAVIEQTIKIVDQEARRSIAEVEKSVARVEGKIDLEVKAVLARMEAGDGELRNALQGIRSRVDEVQRVTEAKLAGIAADIKHLPTQVDLAKVVGTQAENRAGIADNSARIEGVAELARTIRDHLMQARP